MTVSSESESRFLEAVTTLSFTCFPRSVGGFPPMNYVMYYVIKSSQGMITLYVFKICDQTVKDFDCIQQRTLIHAHYSCIIIEPLTMERIPPSLQLLRLSQLSRTVVRLYTIFSHTWLRQLRMHKRTTSYETEPEGQCSTQIMSSPLITGITHKRSKVIRGNQSGSEKK